MPLLEKSRFCFSVQTIHRLILAIFKQSKDECEYLIELAKPNMVKSTVVDSATGQSKDSRFAICMLF